MSTLHSALERLARTPVLLVATDFDGTLAPIVEDPDAARPEREAMIAVRQLAGLPNTHVAIISGRSLAKLAELSGAPEGVHLVGSHGSEFEPDFTQRLSADERERLAQVVRSLEAIAGADPGLEVETKPASVAFHYRRADPQRAQAALETVLAGPGQEPGVHLRHGKMVVELSVVATDKGAALETLRQRVGASAALFCGDDLTDEDAFATLGGPDLSVKVGSGETAARERVSDPQEVARSLAFLAEERAAWLQGSDAVPIDHHSLLSDRRTVALVTPNARISWFCAPRIDSPALFAELVGGPTAGFFAVEPVAGAWQGQAYREDCMTLCTRWEGVSVTDYLDCSMGRPGQRAGRSDLVRVVEGSGEVRLTFAPRLDFGRSETRLSLREGGIELPDSVDPVVLRSPGVAWEIVTAGNHQEARATVKLGPEPLVLELRYGTGNLGETVVPEIDRRRATQDYWREWVASLELPGLARDLVAQSALVLKSLSYGPTGAFAAAATTSLPGTLGGVRNWDYRYTWLRDAALSAEALLELGSVHEAVRFLDWVLEVVDTLPSPERLRPLYLVTGHHLGPEAEIGELAGYAGSRPVRVGNAAAGQLQLDVFGPIVNLVHLMMERGAPLSSEHWRLVEAMVDAVGRRWSEPDHGIWEIRASRRHHVHSKAMCWLTVDRGIALSRRFLGREREEWRALRDAIRADVLEHGYKDERGAFTAAYDGDDLDAAVLVLGTCGLLPPTDRRFVSTVDAIGRELRVEDTVLRYRGEDGLPGREGGFHLCTAWLVDALAAMGRREDALQLFEGFCRQAGPTRLFSEQYHPPGEGSAEGPSGLAMGNHPQAYSHLGLILNALRLERSAP